MLSILAALRKSPDCLGDMHHLLVTVRALPKEQRREAMEDVKAMVKSHVRVTTLRAVDLAHDIALMQEDLAG